MSLIKCNFSGCFVFAFFGMRHANFRQCEFCLSILLFTCSVNLKCISRFDIVAVVVVIIVIAINWLIFCNVCKQHLYYVSFTFSFHSKFILNRINLMNVCCRCRYFCCFSMTKLAMVRSSSYSLSLNWFIIIRHMNAQRETACANFCN